MIDLTLLRPESTARDIVRLCTDARTHHVAAVCVNPVFVELAARELSGTRVRVATVVGFPLGATTTAMKVAEAREAIEHGAAEIDMVMFIGGLKGGDAPRVEEDIRQVVEVCHSHRALCKVILETCLLNQEEKLKAVELCIRAGADFVKTSTGFSTGGATAEDVALLASVAGPAGLGVKAAGGIRTADDVRRMITAGATRIGTSSGVAILQEWEGPHRQ
jgi:deoxyribose-phosphate aldolase